MGRIEIQIITFVYWSNVCITMVWSQSLEQNAASCSLCIFSEVCKPYISTFKVILNVLDKEIIQLVPRISFISGHLELSSFFSNDWQTISRSTLYSTGFLCMDILVVYNFQYFIFYKASCKKNTLLREFKMNMSHIRINS